MNSKENEIKELKPSLKRYVLSKDLNCWPVFDFLNEMSPKDVNIFPRGKSSSNPLFGRRW